MKVLFSSLTLLADTVSSILSIGGSELTNSRRVVDLQGFEACRHQYSSTQTITVRIEWSIDGATWATLIDEYSMDAIGGNGLKVSGWQVIPDVAKQQEVLLRAFAVGSGLLTQVNFVEFQFR